MRPTSLSERLFAHWYPWVTGVSERAGQWETRRDLVAAATGVTVEIGAGSGLDLPWYTRAVTHLVVTEPAAPMMRPLRQVLGTDPPPVGGWSLVRASADGLPMPDRSVDTVVAAFVHCSIPDPRLALVEIHRVLKPGGRYLFLEHVRSSEGTALAMLQEAIRVPHMAVAAGCDPTMRTEALLAASPLRVERLDHGSQPRALPSVRPIILGVAVRD